MLYHLYDTLKVLCLVGNLQWVERLLKLYQWLIQCLLTLDCKHFITKAMPLYYSDGKGHNLELKNGINYSANHTRPTSYLCPHRHTYTQTY